jgi:hypothetical protein
MFFFLVFYLLAMLCWQAYEAYRGEISWFSFAGLVVMYAASWFLGNYLHKLGLLENFEDKLQLRKDLAVRHKEAKAWMLENKPTRIDLNGAIEKLITTGGKDEEAGRLIATLAFSLPSQSHKKYQRIRASKPGIFSGFTQEAGDVAIQAPADRLRYDSNIQAERVGQYKIHRSEIMVWIEGFWESELNTALRIAVDKPRYLLVLSPTELNMFSFGVLVGRLVSDGMKGGKRVIVISEKMTWLSGPSEGKEVEDFGTVVWKL